LGLKHADLLLLSNQEDYKFAQTYYRKELDRVFVFKNGAYSFDFDKGSQKKEEFTILFNGSWIERKGIYTLTKAAAILQQRNLTPKWLIAGTNSTQEVILKDWAKELHPFVKVIPQFQPKEEALLLNRADLFILPSFFEGQPLSLLQAMAAGKCCITTNCCGQKDLIQNHYNGLLYEPGDPVGLADLIEQCITDSSLRISLGAKAKDSTDQRTWETVSMEVVDRLEQLLHYS
jgi:glycosyltransferase involved in cell wall biosynthesis